ncbi:MAG: energy transducer TonB [Acidobacteriota bacterium]
MRRARQQAWAWILLAAAAGLVSAGDRPPTAGEGGVSKPYKVKGDLPRYPLAAMRAEIQGVVDLEIVVLQNGTVSEARVLSSTNPGHGFEKEALRSVRRWTYVPALLHGKPVDARLRVSVEFIPEEYARLRRQEEIRKGLEALARAQIFPEGALVAGEDGVGYPVAQRQRKPRYPEGARLRGIETGVWLLVKIDARGRVAEIPLARPGRTDYPFKEAAIKAVRTWRFRPVTRDGEPVPVYYWLLVDFRMDSRTRPPVKPSS